MQQQQQAPQQNAPEVAAPEARQEAGFEQDRGNGARQADLAINDVRRDTQDDNKPMQAHGDLNLLYIQAADAMVKLGEGAAEVAGTTGGTAKIPDELKGRPRAQEKVANDYKGNAAKLCDIARASIFYDDMGGIERAKSEVESYGGWKVVHAKDRFAHPLDGYRDFTFLVAIDGHVCELQLHLTKIIEAKSIGHAYYERIRTIQGRLDKGENISADEVMQLEKDKAEMKVLFDQAFIDAGGTIAHANQAMAEK